MKLFKSLLMVLIFIFLGYTSFLGGPYLLFRILFWITLFPFIINTFLLVLVLLKTKRILKKNIEEHNQEPIHVDAVIKE